MRIFTGHQSYGVASLASTEELLTALGGRRLELLRTMAGAGPWPFANSRGAAAVTCARCNADSQMLVQCGVLDKAEDGKVEFPYDAVHVDFMVRAA